MHAIFFNEPIERNFIGHIMAEVYKDRVYAPFMEGKKDLTVLDIGANIGLTSYYFSQFAKQVISLEPSLEHFDVFTTMLKYNKIGNVMPVNKALYIKDGVLPFHHNANRTMYSLHGAVDDNSSPTEDVQCTTIKSLFDEYKLDHVDFMKLDVEGSETEIVSHSSFVEVADKIDTMVIEQHSWSGRNEHQLKDALESVGFAVSQFPNDATLWVAKHK